MRLREKASPWFGVLCDPVTGATMRRRKKNERICSRLFQYLLGGGIEDDIDREHLRAEFAEERRVGGNLAVNLDGATVPLDRIRLPHPWR